MEAQAAQPVTEAAPEPEGEPGARGHDSGR